MKNLNIRLITFLTLILSFISNGKAQSTFSTVTLNQYMDQLRFEVSGENRYWFMSKTQTDDKAFAMYSPEDGGWFTYWKEGTGDMIVNKRKLGIGQTVPLAKLHVFNNGNNGAYGLSDYGFVAEASSGQATIGAEGNGDLYANLNLGSNISGTRRLWHISKRTSASSHDLHYYFYDGTTFGQPLYVFRSNGSLGIGTPSPTEKLEVNGTIRSKEVKVEATPWPDYVFAADYPLKSLEETEIFINENKRLPDMPSAAEVAENGIALGEMNRLLVEKVEELTLHLINLQKENAQIKSELSQRPNANSQQQIENKLEELTQHLIRLEKENQNLKTELSQQQMANSQRLEALEKNQKP